MLNSHKRMINRYLYNKETKPLGILPHTLKRVDEDLSGYVRLLVAVMETGLLDKDQEYVNGLGLKIHCDLLNLQYKSVKKAFNSMLRVINSGKEWVSE